MSYTNTLSEHDNLRGKFQGTHDTSASGILSCNNERFLRTQQDNQKIITILETTSCTL